MILMMNKDVNCPFFVRDRGNGKIYCEACSLKCPDNEFRRELVYGFCAHPDNYKSCMLYSLLMKFYERKFAEDVR